MQFGYLLFMHKKQFAGVALCQLQYFKANQSLNSTEEKTYPCFFTTFLNFIRGMVVNQVEFNVLICGNLLLTGEHGFYLDPEIIAEEEHIPLIQEAVWNTFTHLNRKKHRLSCILFKDFEEANREEVSQLKEKDLQRVYHPAEYDHGHPSRMGKRCLIINRRSLPSIVSACVVPAKKPVNWNIANSM